MTAQERTITTAPACWASYLVNGDSSGLSAHETLLCNRFCAALFAWYIIDVVRDENGEGLDPYFTRDYQLYSMDPSGPTGGDVLGYRALKSAETTEDAA